VQALVSHCEQWITKFTLLLHELATEELMDLRSYFHENTVKLRMTPTKLDELAQVVILQKKVDAERSNVHARFEPLQHMFKTLEKVWPIQWHQRWGSLKDYPE
jgi:dynein heavy chain, axonemal